MSKEANVLCPRGSVNECTGKQMISNGRMKGQILLIEINCLELTASQCD